MLERRSIIGGASVTEEIWPGYRVSTAAHMMGLLQPKVILDLELQKFGYEIIPTPPIVHHIENAGPIAVSKEPDKLAAEFARFSKGRRGLSDFRGTFGEVGTSISATFVGNPLRSELLEPPQSQGHGSLRLAQSRHGRLVP